MKVKNPTDNALGFGRFVIDPGETADVDATAADWFIRHGCLDAAAPPKTKATKATKKASSRRSD